MSRAYYQTPCKDVSLEEWRALSLEGKGKYCIRCDFDCQLNVIPEMMKNKKRYYAFRERMKIKRSPRKYKY